MAAGPQTDLPAEGLFRAISAPPDTVLARREAGWDARHACTYSMGNEEFSATSRSYFGRWKDAAGYDLKLLDELRGMGKRWTTDGWKLDLRATNPPSPSNRQQKKQEKTWNNRHSVVYAKDNAKLNVNIRSYFDRSLEPFHPGKSSAPRQKLKTNWNLQKSSKPLSPPPSCRNLAPYNPEFDTPVTFSAGNDEVTANLRDYFDRPRSREDLRRGQPPRAALSITWREPANQPTLLRDGYAPGSWFRPAATDGTGMGVTLGKPIEALGHGMGTLPRETKDGRLRKAWNYPVSPPLRKKPKVGKPGVRSPYRSISTVEMSKSVHDISELV